jgi:hypothetical protein
MSGTAKAYSEDFILRSLEDFPSFKLLYKDSLHDLPDVRLAFAQGHDLIMGPEIQT